MRKIILFGLIVLALLSPTSAMAITCDDPMPDKSEPEKLREYSQSCEEKIGSLQSTKLTLQSAIKLLTSKINLTQSQIRSTNAQIEQLEKEIGVLSEVVAGLNSELDALTEVFVTRVKDSYKNRGNNTLLMFLSSNSYSEFQSRLKYMQVAQRRDQLIMKELESARVDFDQQKTTKEEKQVEIEKLKAQLESQRKVLGVQSAEKQHLLIDTQNSEAKYQALLAKAVAELQAIESIIAGRGSEIEVRSISAGEHIATIIQGASACSSGSHLHFEVVQNKAHRNPSDFLKSIGVTWDNSPDGSFGFNGTWDWPLNDPIRITQGYGHTAYSSRYANNSHTGIDMNSTNSEVKAVRPGKLLRGSIACGGGTLKYVHVKHADDGLDTYYLHVNYF